MDLALRFQLFALLSAILTGSTIGTESFRSRIPNGDRVPHPCNSEYIWREAGYENHHGGGDMNKFGDDFAANNMIWNQAICEMDSDGDGRTNGLELGDPNCNWTLGAQPNRTTGLSHPGVCEPLDSTACAGKNDFVECEGLCSGLGEEGVMRHTVTMTNPVSVPSKTMVHSCMVFDYPSDNDYHIVSVAPHLDNSALETHILVYSCDGENFPEQSNLVHTCYMNPQCGKNTFHWNKGDPDVCLYHEAGIRVGNHTSAIKRGLLELHLYNPGDTTVEDRSGIDIFITPNRRRHNADILSFGQLNVNIPPGEEDYVLTGGCSPRCTKSKMSGPIQVIAAFNRMHYIGVSVTSQWITNERRVNYIAYDDTFSYDYPKYHSFEEPLQINPGDRLKMECHYDSTKRNRTMHNGRDPVENEMCSGLIMYYPSENMELSSCKSYGDLDACDLESNVIRGCDISKQNFSIPENVPEFSIVQDYCKPGICLKECKMLLKRVMRHSCYSGSLRDYMIEHIEEVTDSTEKLNMLSFWLKMRSCDYEFAKDMADRRPNSAIKPFSQSAVSISMILFFVIAKLFS